MIEARAPSYEFTALADPRSVSASSSTTKARSPRGRVGEQVATWRSPSDAGDWDWEAALS
jgi:hypothetical protein